MSDSIYVKVGDAVEQLEIGAAPEYVQRIEALEAGQTAQDTAISDAATAASNAQSRADAAQQSANSKVATVNGQSPDETGNVTLNISAPVTSVNGQTGAVTVGTVRSVNGVSADATGNVTLNISAPVTSVNGMTGAVTISSVSTATTATKATTTPNVFMGNSGNIPAGGTWKVFCITSDGAYHRCRYYTWAGGTEISVDCIAIRIA